MRRQSPRGLALPLPVLIAVVQVASAQNAVRSGQRSAVSQQRLEIYDAVGTFGGDSDSGRDGTWWLQLGRAGRGDAVEIGGRSGLRAWANLEITVPEGRELKVHLAVGRATIDGVSGDVLIDTGSGSARLTLPEDVDARGRIRIVTGSGGVTIR